MSDRNGLVGSGVPSEKIERRRLTAANPAYISPEDARAYAESLLQATLYGPNAYLPEGPRKPLGRLSKDPRDEDAYAPGARVGLSGLQKNLEDVKTELKILVPKVTNGDGVSALNSMISAIQATQDQVGERERKKVYEAPYRAHPKVFDDKEQPNFEKCAGDPTGQIITGNEGPWWKGMTVRSGGKPCVTLKQALAKWVE